MKNFNILHLIFFTLLGFLSNAQTNFQIEPTDEVQASFKKNFPGQSPTWTKNFDGIIDDQFRYEGKFRFNDSDAFAIYNKSGKLLVYAYTIPVSQTPTKALSYIRNNYPKYKVNQVLNVKSIENGNTYEVGILGVGKFYYLVFDSEGEFKQTLNKS